MERPRAIVSKRTRLPLYQMGQTRRTAPVEEGGSGLSSRQAAEVLGVNQATVVRDAADANASEQADDSREARDAADANAPEPTVVDLAVDPAVPNGTREAVSPVLAADVAVPNGTDAPSSTADTYPFMQSWKPYHVAEAGEAAGCSPGRCHATERSARQPPSSSSSAEAAVKSRRPRVIPPAGPRCRARRHPRGSGTARPRRLP